MPTSAPTSGIRRPQVLLTVLLAVLTGVGGWHVALRAATQLAGPTLQVGAATYEVTHVERVTGLAEADLGGMAHGVQGMVRDDQTLVRVSVIVSAGSRGASYDPQVLRLHSSSSAAELVAVGGSLLPGRLLPHGHVEGSLSYVVARDGAQLTLHATGSRTQLPLLRTDRAPRGAGHHMSGSSPTSRKP